MVSKKKKKDCEWAVLLLSGFDTGKFKATDLFILRAATAIDSLNGIFYRDVGVYISGIFGIEKFISMYQ